MLLIIFSATLRRGRKLGSGSAVLIESQPPYRLGSEVFITYVIFNSANLPLPEQNLYR
jgi:hypothetical protein